MSDQGSFFPAHSTSVCHSGVAAIPEVIFTPHWCKAHNGTSILIFRRRQMSALSYFRSPFPSTAGFSPYRMPGTAVHGPFIISFAFLGFCLCWPHLMLRPFLIVWLLAGIYLGRDIAILCHYNPLLTLLSWAAFVVILFKPHSIAGFGTSHIVLPAVLSAGIGAILVAVAFRMTRRNRQ